MEAFTVAKFLGQPFNFVLERLLAIEIMFSDKSVNGSANDIQQKHEKRENKKSNHLIYTNGQLVA